MKIKINNLNIRTLLKNNRLMLTQLTVMGAVIITNDTTFAG